jgi:hypothetical protein
MCDLSPAVVLARLEAFAATHHPDPPAVLTSAQVAAEAAAEHRAEEAKHDRQWASGREMDWLAARRAG